MVSEFQEKRDEYISENRRNEQELQGIGDVVKKVLYVIYFPNKKKGKEIIKSRNNRNKK